MLLTGELFLQCQRRGGSAAHLLDLVFDAQLEVVGPAFEFLFFCRHGKFLERCLKKIEQVLERFQTIRSGGEQ